MNTGAINDIRKAAEAVRIAFNNYVGAQSADEKRQLWKVWDKASSNLHELLSPAHETVLELCRLAEIGEQVEMIRLGWASSYDACKDDIARDEFFDLVRGETK